MPINDVRTRLAPEPTFTMTLGGSDRKTIQTRRNIRAIHLNCSVAGVGATLAEMSADISNIVITYGGQTIVDHWTPAELFMRYHFYNDAKTVITESGDLPLWFTPAEMPWERSAIYFRIGMLKEDGGDAIYPLVVEVNYKSPGGGFTIDTVQMWVETDDDPPETIGDHIRLLRHQSSFAGTGFEHVTDIHKERLQSALRGLWFPTSVGTITNFSLIEDAVYRLENVPVTIMQEKQFHAGRVPQTGYEFIGWNLSNDPAGLLRVDDLRKLDVMPYWSVTPAGVYDILCEFLYRGMQG